MTFDDETASVTFDDESLMSLASGLDSEGKDDLLELISLAQFAAFCRPAELIELDMSAAERPSWNSVALDQNVAQLARQQLSKGSPVGVRVKLRILRKAKIAAPNGAQTHFEFFIRRTATRKRRPVFIRGGILIPDVHAPHAAGMLSLVIIEDSVLSEFIGDAENPAHTQRLRQSSHFKGKYKHGEACLDFIIKSVSSFLQILQEGAAEEDRLILAEFFPAPEDRESTFTETDIEPDPRKQRGIVSPGTPEIDILSRHPLRIEKIDRGFKIEPSSPSTVSLPCKLIVDVAYDTRHGYPLAQYHPLDFCLNRAPIRMNPEGAEVVFGERNRIVARVIEPEFVLTVQGFDTNRDLYVRATLEECSNDPEDQLYGQVENPAQ